MNITLLSSGETGETGGSVATALMALTLTYRCENRIDRRPRKRSLSVRQRSDTFDFGPIRSGSLIPTFWYKVCSPGTIRDLENITFL